MTKKTKHYIILERLGENMKYLVLTVGLFFIGCSSEYYNQQKSYTTNSPSITFGFSKVCVDRVVYITASKRLTIWINPTTLKPNNCDVVAGKLLLKGK